MGLLLCHIIPVLCGCQTSTCLELKVKKKNTRGNPTPKSRLHHPWKLSHFVVMSICLVPGVSSIFQSMGFALSLLCFGRILLLHIVTKLQNSMEVANELQLLRLFEDLVNLCCHPGLDTTERKCLWWSWFSYSFVFSSVIILHLPFVFIELWKLPLRCVYSCSFGLVLPNVTLIALYLFPSLPLRSFLVWYK